MAVSVDSLLLKRNAHVPKFGDWEEGSVPYTVHFENARKGKSSGRRMNPNDPEDNPEIFKALAETPMSKKPVQSLNQPTQHYCGKPGRRKGSKSSYSSFSSSISSDHPKPPTNILHWQTQPKHHRAASIPKFGDWDARDQTSGEGFTVIFNKVKQEKHVRTINLQSLAQPHDKPGKTRNKAKCGLASKIPKFLQMCCCSFQ